jgi:hypothetical protein
MNPKAARPAGSRAIDRTQPDLFPMDKFLAQCGWEKSRPASERAFGAPPQAAFPPATNRGGKVLNAELENLKDFCDF